MNNFNLMIYLKLMKILLQNKKKLNYVAAELLKL